MQHNIDLLIEERRIARESKNWDESDRIREILDSELVFTFDTKDGQEVYHLNEEYFKNKDKLINTMGMSNRQYVEYRIQRDIRANNNFESWLYSIKQSNK